MIKTLALLPSMGPTEWIALMVLGLLLFGRRLPEVGKSLGRGIVEFKKGLKGVEDEIEDQSSKPSRKAAPLPAAESPVRIEPPRNAEGVDVRVSRADAVE